MVDPLPPPCPSLDIGLIVSETVVVEVEYHERIDSTNDRAKALARLGNVPLPRLIVAGSQTAGRGRGSRSWWTGPNSLAFSLLTDTESWSSGPSEWPIAGLAAGVSLVEAVGPELPGREVGLHWPNDVFVEGRKLAGILVESPAPKRLVVGIGVNTNSPSCLAPEPLRGRIVSLTDLTGRRHDHTNLLAAWLRRWALWTGRLPGGAPSIAEHADRLCLQRGRRLRLRQGNRVCEGTCLGIDRDGSLLLETEGRIERFLSGSLE